MNYFYFYESPIGILQIEEYKNNICKIKINNEKSSSSGEEFETKLIKKAHKELNEYFMGKRKEFTLPLAPEGSAFQKKVWTALTNIPYGKTCSYKYIAEAINNPKACRAVGGANNKNPIIIVIPCHRVIGADGSLTGYGGGLSVKEYLLNLEKKWL